MSNLLGWNPMEDNMKKKKNNVNICMTGSLCCTAELKEHFKPTILLRGAKKMQGFKKRILPDGRKT